MNIDKRHIYGIMLDTETANSLDDPLFYDCGWAVIDSHGRVYKEQSFINREIFVDRRDLMQTAYYANKIPSYVEDLRNGVRRMANLYEIKRALAEDVKEYDCKFICAHNARFDYKSLNTTQRYLSKSASRYFVPYGLEWWDTLKMAKDVILPMPTYKAFCEENGFMTNHKNPRPQLTAEVLYKFITRDMEFSEVHKGLDDVLIEAQILAYCVRRHKKMNKKLWKG